MPGRPLLILGLTLLCVSSCSAPGGSRRATGPAVALPSLEELSALSDSEVEDVILDRIIAANTDNAEREGDLVRNLPAGARMLYATWSVEAEVNNGGFQQYFWNTGGQFANEALAGFELLRADQHAALMRRAIEIAEAERSLREKYKGEESKEAFIESYQHTKLGELDAEFYELPDLRPMRLRLIREQPDLFAAK